MYPAPLILLLSMAAILARAAGGSEHTAPLFADDSLLEVRIEAPFTTLMRERPDVEYLEGTFAYAGPDGAAPKFDLKLRTRGNYRRDAEHCDFAPIRLNFRKSQVQGTLLSGQDKLKLVTHCRSRERKFDRYVLREYLAYRLLNALTPISYKVRLMRVTYADTEGGPSRTRLGFVIEDEAAVAARNGLNIVSKRWFSWDEQDQRRQNLVHIFQYMIGNTEYSLVNPEPGKDCCHNAIALSQTSGPPYIAVPFDFDFSGLVNAPYAQPNPRYPVRKVRTRHYRGLCINNDLVPQTLQLFLDARDELYRLVEEAHDRVSLSPRSARHYLDSFYKNIRDPDALRKSLTGVCYEATG